MQYTSVLFQCPPYTQNFHVFLSTLFTEFRLSCVDFFWMKFQPYFNFKLGLRTWIKISRLQRFFSLLVALILFGTSPSKDAPVVIFPRAATAAHSCRSIAAGRLGRESRRPPKDGGILLLIHKRTSESSRPVGGTCRASWGVCGVSDSRWCVAVLMWAARANKVRR